MNCSTEVNILSANLTVLQSRYPEIAVALENLPKKDKFRIFQAKDGGVAYGLEAENGKTTPISDAMTPTARIQAQLNQSMEHLTNFTKPVLIAGLYPGNELLYIYDLSEKTAGNHAKQPIYVCIDSLYCLFGFLQAWDARHLLQDERVYFFLAEHTNDFISAFHSNPERPYSFTLISGAPPVLLNKLMPPFASLVMERDRELDRLLIQNEQYYNMLSDEELAKMIAGTGNRKPRLLMPTCSWSTFVQHSTRDLCAAFEQMGWDVRVINTDAMLTKYYLAHQINTFKPDVFLFIDHLRSEAEDVYPANMLFVTWVQDEMDHFFQEQAGQFIQARAQLRKRDLLVGYVDRLLDPQYAYPRDRLVKMSIPADTNVFKPATLSACDQERYACDLAFASNVSTSTEQIMNEQIIPEMTAMGFPSTCLMDIHDHLWAEYRAGQTFSLPAKFERELQAFPTYTQGFEALDIEARQRVHTLLYWRLNNTIYRHVVLEWADDLGLDMHLYGEGWDHHPRFAKYAHAAVPHGAELNKAYQAAGINLHLNVAQGMHQRIWELVSAQVPILVRSREKSPAKEPPLLTMHMLADTLCADPFGPAFEVLLESNSSTEELLVDWIFRQALNLHFTDSATQGFVPSCITTSHVLKHIKNIILSRPDWVIPMREAFSFHDKGSFASAIQRAHDYKHSSRRSIKPLGYEYTAAELTDHLLALLDADSPSDPALNKEEQRQTMYGSILDTTVKLAALFAHHTKTVREAPKDHTWINPLTQAFEAFPLKTYELRVRLADVLAHAHHLEAVLCCLPDNIASEPLSDDVHTRLAGVYIACGDLSQAVYHLSQVAADQRYAYWHRLQCILQLTQGRYVTACEHMTRTQQPDTTTLHVLSDMAVVIKRAMDNPVAIIDAPTAIKWILDQTADMDNRGMYNLSSSPSMQELEGVNNLALWAHQNNNHKALKTLQAVFDCPTLPETPSALNRLGMIHFWLGQPEKTIQAFELVIKQHATTEITARLLLYNYIACWQFSPAEEFLHHIAPTYSDRSWWYYFSLILRYLSGQPILESDFPTQAPAGSREAIILMTFGTLAVHCGYAQTGLQLLAYGKDYALAQLYEAIAHQQLGDETAARNRLTAFNPEYDNPASGWLTENSADHIADEVLRPLSGLSPLYDFWKNMIMAILMHPFDTSVEPLKKRAEMHTATWHDCKNGVQYMQLKQGGTRVE